MRRRGKGGKEWRKHRARHRGERDRGEETEGERRPWNGEKTERKRQRGKDKGRKRWNGRQRDENKMTDIRRDREKERGSCLVQQTPENFRTTEFLAVLKREKLSEKILEIIFSYTSSSFPSKSSVVSEN